MVDVFEENKYCPVCINTINESNVVCPFCGYIACKSCTERYIFSQANTGVHCMEPECKTPWPLEFMVHRFGVRRVYGESYAKHLHIENVELRLDELDAESKLARIVLQKCKTRIKPLDLLCPCPVDDCKGLVEIKTHKCTICRTELCRKCRCPFTSRKNHDCCDYDLLTIGFLKQDTKSCPTCAVPIHKISGCDHIICVKCDTAFSWKTGKLDKGFHVHNPHALRRLVRVFIIIGLYYWWIVDVKSTNLY